jgi:hypothetical protein
VTTGAGGTINAKGIGILATTTSGTLNVTTNGAINTTAQVFNSTISIFARSLSNNVTAIIERVTDGTANVNIANGVTVSALNVASEVMQRAEPTPS